MKEISSVREANRADRPKGKEAQCPICWRIFSSDRNAEAHKPYARPHTPACKDPSVLGMKVQERRGLRVWMRDVPHGRFGS